MPVDAQREIVFALLDAAARIERRLSTVLSNVRGVSFSEYRLLLELSKLHDATAMRVELAAAVGLSPSAVTRALKPLEKIGLITTHKAERDARRSLARLTAAGHELLSDADAVVDAVIDALDFSAVEPTQMAEFLSSLALGRSR